MDFSVLVHMTPRGPRSFPLSGLKDLAPAGQETGIEIITKPPVNQILHVSKLYAIDGRSDPHHII